MQEQRKKRKLYNEERETLLKDAGTNAYEHKNSPRILCVQ